MLVVFATAVAGCDIVRRRLGEWRQLDPTSIAPVDPPNPALAGDAVVATARRSVVKTVGVANSCQRQLEGSGFVIAPNRVMATAHSVAGADAISVELDQATYRAKVLSYDPQADISILDVPDLTAPPMEFVEAPAQSGTDALILGYPGGLDFAATPSRVRQVVNLDGPDIYQTTTVTREVYAISGSVKQGDSGGPLISLDGRVLGVLFGSAVDEPEMGFALTAHEVARQIVNVGTEPVATGDCIG
jgi:S1-C subfamily serine protease